MSDKLTELGIPPSEITPAVSIAVNGLLEHIEYLNKNLLDVYEQLESLQNLIDIDTSPAIPNKKSFIKRLDWTIQMSRRTQQPSCVVVFRIRNFEEFETNFGFQATNTAINHISRALSASIRDTDFFARIGNYDFAAIMFFADHANAYDKAMRLCHELANKPLFWNGKDIMFDCVSGTHQIVSSDTADNALLAAHNSLFAEIQKKPIIKQSFDS